MEIDLAQLDSSAAGSDLLRAPICIIGGGIAGLTLAHKLVALGQEVLLLEAGGHAPCRLSGFQDGDLRGLGGTSLDWGGQLLPLPDDSSWPVSGAELASFSPEAEQLLGVDSLPYDAEPFFRRINKDTPSPLQQIPHLHGSLSKFAPFSHRNLASTIGRKLLAHSKARVVLHADVSELVLAESRDHIEAVLARTPSGRTVRIEASQVIVAAGTIGSVRLLLASRSVAPEGIGNANDQVGRNFHNHLSVSAASLMGTARTKLLAELGPWIFGGTLHSLKLGASPALQKEIGLTPVMAHLTIDEPPNSGVDALRSALRARQRNNLRTTVRSLLPRVPAAVADAAHLSLSARLKHRRYVTPGANVSLRMNAAAATPSLSRITVLPDGQPFCSWRSEGGDEFSTMRRFAQHVREYLDMPGIHWNPTLFDPSPTSSISGVEDAHHRMGGATMGIDPQTSVVDRDLRVHGIRNLFLASAAVFPDGSPQLPTLPLMALTLRLAQHLHKLSSD